LWGSSPRSTSWSPRSPRGRLPPMGRLPPCLAARGPRVPWHRVIRQSGELAPGYVFGGYDAQRAELEAEGVLFRPDGKVDMKVCLWDPCDDDTTEIG